jgi:membrane-bound lytic murein transglycosylase D
MLLRTVVLGLVALVTAACAELPSSAPETLAQSGPAAAPVPASKEHLQAQAAGEALARTPPPALVQQTEAPAQTPPPPPAAEAPPPPIDVWQRIRAGFRLNNLDGVLVQRQEQWYAGNPEYVTRMVDRGSHFLYHVVEEVERRKMPTEIALLPMIESAYNPQAYSRAHASGMWQFIPSTGKIYGLRQNFWYDGRRDVLAATGAALDYLQKLYDQFGDWTLALAAYNWGEGAVSRAIARNQARGLPTDYESLAMPLETRTYVPKLQAVKNIVLNPAQFGIKLADVPNRPYFATVTARRHIDVQLAASLAEMSLEEFRFLNPAHNKPVIKAGSSETIVLPVDKVAVFEKNFETHDRPLVSWQAYTMKRSDRPEQVAAKHGMTLAELKSANNIPGNKKIVAGQTLLVPLRGNADPHLPDLPAPKVTLTRNQPRRAKCYQVSNNGAKKQVACAHSPAKTKTATAAAKQPGKQTTPSAQARAAGG